MEIEDRLNALEFRYRTTLGATAAAKSHYLALLDEPSATPEARKRAHLRWENLETRMQAAVDLLASFAAAQDWLTSDSRRSV